MNREQLQDIFRQPYNAQSWQELLINLFGASEIYKEPKRTSLTSDSNEKVEGFELGRLYTADRYEIGLFAFEIKQGHNVQLNRVGLRSLVRSYTRYNVDAALVVYYDATHWRLSFICDIKEQKTAPKRYTYVFGNSEESYRTASAMLAKLNGKPIFEDIKAAFSVEALSKDFFKGYKERYAIFSKKVAEQFGGEEKWQRDYVKKMMGRLVFLQFLQKKGWMGVPSANSDWEGGDLQYTKNLIKRYNDNEKLLSEILEPLFFDTLNTKRDGDIADQKLGDNIKIPYLNGGLFDKDKLDEKLIDFPYSYFAELMDFFSQYNFTIDENDPNDAEVGIDPEMLGHIFENLLEDNKDKGAFYTPKEIVQYMCRQSLIEYLQSKLGKHTEIERFINNHDTGNRTDTKNFIATNARKIEELLDCVKICDPAIGSGAFPMGILNEIFHAKMALDMTLDRAAVKKNIIQNSIYGVDIEQGAVDIARLRFWLSLVVDEDEPQPLPNLDYKIMQGNSLLESFMGIDLSKFSDSTEPQGSMLLTLFEADGTQKAIMDLTREYFAVTDHTRKQALRREIDCKVREHIKRCSNNAPQVVAAVEALEEGNYPFFLWHVYFADVFDKGGFDIVIGNPPYIQLQANGGVLAEQLKNERYETFARTGDIYCVFYEKGLQVLREGGIEIFITSNKWMRAGYGEATRRFFAQKCNPLLIIDFAGVKVFESATVDVNILMASKSANLRATRACVIKQNSLENLSHYIEQNLSVSNFSTSDSWVVLSPIEQQIKEKIERIGTPLKDWDINIYRGVLTGYNEAFIISGAKRDELIAADPKSAEIIRPILRGRDIKRYGYDFADLWLINTHNGIKEKGIKRIAIEDYPAVKEHLDQYWEQIEKRADQGDTPYNLRNCAYMDDFNKQKIVYPNMTKYMPFVLDEDGYCVNQKCFIMTGENLPYLTAFFNSNVFKICYRDSFPELQGGTRELSKIFFENVKVPPIESIISDDFDILVNDAQQGKDNADIRLERALLLSLDIVHYEDFVLNYKI